MCSEGTINSENLQDKFQSTYNNFFGNNGLVVSGNSVMTWGNNMSHGINLLRIKQKTPTKTYCGIKLNDTGKINFNKVIYYSSIDDTFKEKDFIDFYGHEIGRITKFIDNYLKNNGFNDGVEINFLTESPKGHGFGFSAVISVLVAFFINILIGKLDIKILDNYEDFLKTELFEEIYKLTFHLSQCISSGTSSGANNFCMMNNISLPIIQFTKKFDSGCLENKCAGGCDSMINPYLNVFSYKDSLINFLGISGKVEELPIDYGILFTGLEYSFREIESTREKAKNENEALKKFILEKLEAGEIKNSDFFGFSDFLALDNNAILNLNLSSNNLKMVKGFDSLLRNQHDDDEVNKFINTFRESGSLSFLYEKENKLYSTLQYLFYKFRTFEDENIGFLPFNIGKPGGSIFFVAKHNKSRDTIRKVLEHVKNEGYNVVLDYASWRDGTSKDGIKIEQYINKGLYSKFIKEGNISFSDTEGNNYIGNYNDIIENENDGILLDTIKNRVYIKGNKLTSQDIHSQNATINVLSILMLELGEDVPNTRFPSSSYSKNKNEVLTKIVIPLHKLTNKYFGEKLSLSCKGGITDYYLKLKKDDFLKIGILKKI